MRPGEDAAAALQTLVVAAHERGASDIHVVPGEPAIVRVDGNLMREGEPLDAEKCRALAAAALGIKELDLTAEVDAAITVAHIRCRVNVFLAQTGVCLALRLLSDTIPELEELNLPPVVASFASRRDGLILVTGQTGSGKSTTLAALIQRINQTRACHIMTLEDPIEYLHSSEKALVCQREVGRDTSSFASGLRAMMREDPDVILVGEMRDLDTIEVALTAAETGHLVLGTLHTQSAPDAVDRLLGAFPKGRQEEARTQLSLTLAAVVAQRLVPGQSSGRVAAAEVMVVTPAIRNLIREGKTQQLANAVATSAVVGGVSLEASLTRLVQEGRISREIALENMPDASASKRINPLR
ncbi:MAG: type IV pilus twitching motility protein PilT [Atopobiaceae bacterium]|jgi:twitching motility protein PilT